jgi:hypothetical protein
MWKRYDMSWKERTPPETLHYPSCMFLPVHAVPKVHNLIRIWLANLKANFTSVCLMSLLPSRILNPSDDGALFVVARASYQLIPKRTPMLVDMCWVDSEFATVFWYNLWRSGYYLAVVTATSEQINVTFSFLQGRKGVGWRKSRHVFTYVFICVV